MSGAEAEQSSGPGPGFVLSGFGPDKNGFLRSYDKKRAVKNNNYRTRLQPNSDFIMVEKSN